MSRILLLLLPWLFVSQTAFSEEPWKRHTIDDSSRGADGVRIDDVNGDGHPDLTTGWEEGGKVRVYLNPGPEKVKEQWPAVTVGNVKSPEDAVFADLNGDGAVDVVSSCEGSTQTVFVHWAPKNADDYLNPDKWSTAGFRRPRRKHAGCSACRWMSMVRMVSISFSDQNNRTPSSAGSNHPPILVN